MQLDWSRVGGLDPRQRARQYDQRGQCHPWSWPMNDIEWYPSPVQDDGQQKIMEQLVVFRGGRSDPRRSATWLSTLVARLEHQPVVVVLMYSLKFSSTVVSALKSSQWGPSPQLRTFMHKLVFNSHYGHTSHSGRRQSAIVAFTVENALR